MNNPYTKVYQLIIRYCFLLSDGRFEEEIDKVGHALTGFSNFKREKYLINCSIQAGDNSEMIFISYSNQLDSLVDFANELSLNKDLEGLKIVIYRAKEMNIVCRNSPLGMIFL